jgi:sterol desaturase/sphingolipid hydroxylase (fatty acid hydroxylase superfamily)
LAAAVLIGFPPLMVLMFSAISLVYQFWIHTETDRADGAVRVGNEHAVAPPCASRDQCEYLDANYAGVLIIWDRMFGTFVPEDSKEKTALRHRQSAWHVQSVPRRVPRMGWHLA